MHDVPMPSWTASPAAAEVLTATRAMIRPTRAPRSSSSTTGSSGVRLVRTKRHHDASPSSGRASTMAVRKLNVRAHPLPSHLPSRLAA